MILVSRMTSQDHVIKGSCDFKGRILFYPVISQKKWLKMMFLSRQEPIKVGHHPVKFDCHYGSEDIMILICDVVLQKQAVNRLYGFIGKSPLR